MKIGINLEIMKVMMGKQLFMNTQLMWIQLGEDLVTSSTQDVNGKWTVYLAADGMTVAVGVEDKRRVIVYKYNEDNTTLMQMGNDIYVK